ncbi:MAG: flagellar basal body P-ring formation chaperone FlgA [Bdellovibrionales bacterium]
MKNILPLFLLATLAYASEKMELRLRSSVQIGTAVPLMLEDLVDSARVPAEALNLEIPTTATQLSRDEILEVLKKAKTERRELSAYRFKIPNEIQIERIKGFARDQISQRAINRLNQRCTSCDFQVQIKNVPEVAEETVRLEWRELPLSGPFMVSVTNPSGHTLAWVSGQIRTEKPIVKTSRALRPGDTIQAEDVRLEKADISFNKDHFVELQQVLGKKVSRAIAVSSALSSLDLQRNLDVKQGQIIRIISGNEVFEVSSQATAQDSGVMGDVIRVRHLENQKILSGRILEKGLVRVE